MHLSLLLIGLQRTHYFPVNHGIVVSGAVVQWCSLEKCE